MINALIFIYRPRIECKWVWRTTLGQECKLERKTGYEPIEKIAGEYHIYSPRYYIGDYRNNTYCVWNVANSGYINYHIMSQQLQQPANMNSCSGPGCNCPDSVTITMGTNELKLCGSAMPSATYYPSSNGLHVRFCSDNKQTARGFFIRVYKPNGATVGKREAQQVTI